MTPPEVPPAPPLQRDLAPDLLRCRCGRVWSKAHALAVRARRLTLLAEVSRPLLERLGPENLALCRCGTVLDVSRWVL